MALHCQVCSLLWTFCCDAFWVLAAKLVGGRRGNLVEESYKEPGVDSTEHNQSQKWSRFAAGAKGRVTNRGGDNGLGIIKDYILSNTIFKVIRILFLINIPGSCWRAIQDSPNGPAPFRRPTSTRLPGPPTPFLRKRKIVLQSHKCKFTDFHSIGSKTMGCCIFS